MHTDADFLSKLLENPADDDPRLVYADWLDDQGDPVSSAKAEFLRVTVELAARAGKRGWRKARKKRLQELAAKLDTNWLPVVSRLAIEICHQKRMEDDANPVGPLRFEFLCDRRWEDLKPTANDTIRSCEVCKQNVHYCDTITEARRHAGYGHCIAIDLGVIRRDRDLEPEYMYAARFVGRPSAEMLQREQERMQPDAVSAERERRKRSQHSETSQTQVVPGDG